MAIMTSGAGTILLLGLIACSGLRMLGDSGIDYSRSRNLILPPESKGLAIDSPDFSADLQGEAAHNGTPGS